MVAIDPRTNHSLRVYGYDLTRGDLNCVPNIEDHATQGILFQQACRSANWLGLWVNYKFSDKNEVSIYEGESALHTFVDKSYGACLAEALIVLWDLERQAEHRQPKSLPTI